MPLVRLAGSSTSWLGRGQHPNEPKNLVSYVRPARIAEGEENRMPGLVSQGSLSGHVANHPHTFRLGLGAEASIDEEHGVQSGVPAVEGLSLSFDPEGPDSDLIRVAFHGGLEADEIALGFLPLAVGIGGWRGNRRSRSILFYRARVADDEETKDE